MSYQQFLQSKSIEHAPNGFDITSSELGNDLFDWQAEIVRVAVKIGRFALFEDCGLGKTLQQLKWAEIINAKTGNDIIILAPLAVAYQTKCEGEKFGVSVNICRDDADVKPGINITNYELIHRFNMSRFGGVVLDESGILKNFTGKIRNQIIDTFAHTFYKLCCTATPSPNDFTELGNTSEFLGVMSRSEMLAMFFINDTANTGTWRLKGHASESKFWEWVSKWSVMARKPSDIGYSDTGFELPELITNNIILKSKSEYQTLFNEPAKTLSERRDARKESLNDRVSYISDIVNKSSDQWVIWCDFNIENDLLSKSINESVDVKGSHSPEYKEKSMIEFARGNIKCLISKPSIAGFGMNWQNCHNVAYCGLSDSYEKYYQSIRRCWRFGQKHNVNVYNVIGEREKLILDNINKKAVYADDMYQNMIDISKRYGMIKLDNIEQYDKAYTPKVELKLPNWI